MPSNDETRAGTNPEHVSDSDDSFALSHDDQEKRSPTPNSPSFFEDSIDSTLVTDHPPLYPFKFDSLPKKFSQYNVLEILGEGGAGMVFRAIPDSDHEPTAGYSQVALKVIRPEIVTNKKALKRFEKESRLLAEIASPYVTRHLEFGVHRGVYFIASEFVEGHSLDRILAQLHQLRSKQILRIVADLLKALSAMHSKGVIHRDIKPANVIAHFQHSNDRPATAHELGEFQIAKLTDFGLARHIDQSQSLAMTRQHATLGTPTYMAPEQQAASETADARADVYSVGATLYHLLTGETPFDGKSQIEMADMHRNQRPMPLNLRRKEISEAINSVVMKAMEKDPNLRYQDAEEMLSDVNRILNNQPTALRLYPETPDSSDATVKKYDFQWTLDSTPKSLWPLISDTDRFNRAIGLPAPDFSYDHTGNELKIFAKANFNGMNVQWREHPFQWICEREMSVLREFETGPFEWVTSTVELHPLADGKTRLLHRFQVKPRGLFGRLLTPFQFGFMTRRSLDKVYQRLERLANDQSCLFGCDAPFGSEPKISRTQRARLAKRIDLLGSNINDIVLAERFGEFILQVADPMAARIRPLALAPKLGCSKEQSLAMCRSGIETGLLNLSWDIICPVCRIASDNIRSIDQLESHAHCKVCNIEFETDLSQAVEMIFSVHPDIRSIELKTWCIGGPFNAPHVLAQNRLREGQHVDMGVQLLEGKYEITGPQLDEKGELIVSQDASASRAIFAISDQSPEPMPALRSGPACVKVENQSKVEVLVRLSRLAVREDAMTAAMAQRHELFKKLFPDDVHQTEQLVAVANLHLLAIRHVEADSLLDHVGDVQVQHYWNQLQRKFPTDQKRCTIEKCDFESMLVSFGQVDDLLNSLDQIVNHLKGDSGISIEDCCFVIQSGEVMTGSVANQPSAFGKTVRQAKKLVDGLAAKELLAPKELEDSLQTKITRFKPQLETGSSDDNDTIRFVLQDADPS